VRGPWPKVGLETSKTLGQGKGGGMPQKRCTVQDSRCLRTPAQREKQGKKIEAGGRGE